MIYQGFTSFLHQFNQFEVLSHSESTCKETYLSYYINNDLLLETCCIAMHPDEYQNQWQFLTVASVFCHFFSKVASTFDAISKFLVNVGAGLILTAKRISPKVVWGENIVTKFSSSLIMQQKLNGAVMTGDAYLGFEGFWDLQIEEHGLNQQVDVQPPARECQQQLLECVWKREEQMSRKQMKFCQVIMSPKKIFFSLISL